MNRPDAMDLDVAALLGVDAAKFVQAPARARRPAKSSRTRSAATPAAWAAAAQRSPWLWVIVPLAAALVVGVGMSWRSDKAPPPERTAAQAVQPEPAFRAAPAPSRAMSLRIIDGPKRAPARVVVAGERPRPRNIPMAELGLPPSAASSHQATPAPDASSGAEEVPHIEATSWFSDQELAPSPPPPPEAPIVTAP
jgi:hypothetical protein